MTRIWVAAACLLPLGLAAEAAISRNSPEAAVRAAYAADEPAIEGRGAGIMGDNTLRARFFSRALLRSIAADELIAGARDAAPAIVGDPFSDRAPRLSALSVTPISENRNQAKVLVEFVRGDGAREKLTYALVYERGQWRIDDIVYAMLDGGSHTLRGLIAAN